MSKIMELADHYACLNKWNTTDSANDARAALQAEVEKIELLATATHIVMAERDALREKLASVEKDAARYRWLTSDKADGRNSTGMARVAVYTVWSLFTRDELADKGDIDAAIDAVMEETK